MEAICTLSVTRSGKLEILIRSESNDPNDLFVHLKDHMRQVMTFLPGGTCPSSLVGRVDDQMPGALGLDYYGGPTTIQFGFVRQDVNNESRGHFFVGAVAGNAIEGRYMGFFKQGPVTAQNNRTAVTSYPMTEIPVRLERGQISF